MKNIRIEIQNTSYTHTYNQIFKLGFYQINDKLRQLSALII